MSLLSVHNASTGYGNKQVLFDINLDVEKGDTVLLVGSNGSGKSTLLKLIYGLVDVWQGSVDYDGEVLHGMEKKTPTHTLLNRGIMYVPQKNELFDDASVLENLQFSLLHLNNRKESARRIDEVMEEMSLLKERRKQIAGRLSGGERKMLTLGMVMVNRPKLLLYDEPLAGLSEDKIPDVLDLLGRIRAKGTTMMVVEHHVAEMMPFASRIYGMRLGQMPNESLNSLEEIKRVLI